MESEFSFSKEGKMAKATWNGVVLAESNNTVIVEGNHYFPADSVNMAYFQPNSSHTICPWKGVSSYYDVIVNGSLASTREALMVNKSNISDLDINIITPRSVFSFNCNDISLEKYPKKLISILL